MTARRLTPGAEVRTPLAHSCQTFAEYYGDIERLRCCSGVALELRMPIKHEQGDYLFHHALSDFRPVLVRTFGALSREDLPKERPQT
jgi:hypothetical protein